VRGRTCRPASAVFFKREGSLVDDLTGVGVEEWL